MTKAEALLVGWTLLAALVAAGGWLVGRGR